MKPGRTPQAKLVQLEAIRGIASIVVIFHHSLLAFMPLLKQAYPTGLMNTPIYWAVNGGAAVNLFFVLSGFVLTRRFFERRAGQRDLLWAALKRLPRLAVPAGASILVGYSLFELGLNFNVTAASLSGSEWLATFGHAHFPSGFQPKLSAALHQSILVFLLKDNFYYNSNLWTMRPEFLGSLFCFACVYVSLLLGQSRPKVEAFLALACGLVALFFSSFLLPFFLGTLLARLLPLGEINISRATSLILTIAGLLLCSYAWYYTETLGSLLIVFVALTNRAVGRLLSGRTGYLLGAMSFPLYLVHTLVICSVSSLVYARLAGAGYGLLVSSSAAIATTLVASVVVALPFLWLDHAWVAYLNRFVKRLRIPGATTRQSESLAAPALGVARDDREGA